MAATKLIEVRLSALVKLVYKKTIRVPEDTTKEDIDELVQKIQEYADGGEFEPEDAFPGFWEDLEPEWEENLDNSGQDAVSYTWIEDDEGNLSLEEAEEVV